MISRTQIITEARSWIGTKFHHQGRLKKSTVHKGGCDCLGLLVGVAHDLQMRSPKDKSRAFLSQFDDTAYSRIPNGKKLQERLENLLYPIDADNMNIADVLLLKFGKNPQHLGLVSDYPDGFGLIHCFRQIGQVVEHRLDDYWREKIVGVYSFFGCHSS